MRKLNITEETKSDPRSGKLGILNKDDDDDDDDYDDESKIVLVKS